MNFYILGYYRKVLFRLFTVYNYLGLLKARLNRCALEGLKINKKYFQSFVERTKRSSIFAL